jgi:hypothetical protein
MRAISEGVLAVGEIVKALLTAGGIAERKIAAVVGDERTLTNADTQVVYRQMGAEIDRTKPGGVALAGISVEIVCWGETYLAATQEAKEVNAAMDGQRGAVAGWQVSHVSLFDVADIYDERRGAYGKRLFYNVSL